jgi:hypothetical protein
VAVPPAVGGGPTGPPPLGRELITTGPGGVAPLPEEVTGTVVVVDVDVVEVEVVVELVVEVVVVGEADAQLAFVMVLLSRVTAPF